MAFVIRQMSVLSHESDIFGGLRAVHSHGNEWFHRKAMHPCDRRHIVLTDGYAGFIVGRIGHVAGPRQRIHDNARGINEVAMNFRKDRKRVVWGTSVSVRVDTGGRRLIQKKKKTIK